MVGNVLAGCENLSVMLMFIIAETANVNLGPRTILKENIPQDITRIRWSDMKLKTRWQVLK